MVQAPTTRSKAEAKQNRRPTHEWADCAHQWNIRTVVG